MSGEGRAPTPPGGPVALYPPGFVPTAQRVDSWWGMLSELCVHFKVRQSLVQSVVHQESGGDPYAFRIEPRLRDISVGLMQVLWQTARSLGWLEPLPHLFDPEHNLHVGILYLTGLRARFGTEELALIAYNAGPGAAAARKLTGLPVPGLGYARNVAALAQLYRVWNVEHHRMEVLL